MSDVRERAIEAIRDVIEQYDAAVHDQYKIPDSGPYAEQALTALRQAGIVLVDAADIETATDALFHRKQKVRDVVMRRRYEQVERNLIAALDPDAKEAS